MTTITVELPKDLQYLANMPEIEFSIWAQKVIKERIEQLEKTERFKRIVAKSKATEKDVQELTDEINEALAKHYAKY